MYGRTLGHRWVTVHRLAAHLWLGMDIDDPACVCHHCDNPICFHPEHLYIGNRATNAADRGRRKRGREHRSCNRGEAHPLHKLAEADVREMVQLVESGMSQQAVADRYGLRQGSVSRIVRKLSWSHLWSE